MPLFKKLIKLGKSSRAVVIPSEWLEYYRKRGLSIEAVLMEINGEIVMRIPTEAEGRLINVEDTDGKQREIADKPKEEPRTQEGSSGK